MLPIVPIRPGQAPEVKRLIYTIAQDQFPSELSLEENIARYEARGELSDLDDIEKNYFQNGGVFLVMLDRGRVIGSGALRYLEPGVVELKRLWFLPEYQGRGLGYRMIQELFAIARRMGYRTMRLKTDGIYQTRAVAFYRRLGFYEIPDYNADPDDVAMEIAIPAE